MNPQNDNQVSQNKELTERETGQKLLEQNKIRIQIEFSMKLKLIQ